MLVLADGAVRLYPQGRRRLSRPGRRTPLPRPVPGRAVPHGPSLESCAGPAAPRCHHRGRRWRPGIDPDGGSPTCAGAVAPRPRLLPAVDAALAGVSITDDAAIRKACEAATEGAAPLPGTAYKKTLLPVAIRRAVLAAANPGGDA